MRIDYYRCTSSVSLETTSQNVQAVRLGQESVELTDTQIRITDILLKYPDASADEILTGLAAQTCKNIGKAGLAAELEHLQTLGIVEMHAEDMRISIPYSLEHKCDMCGCSCLAQLVGPLNDEEHANILEAHKTLEDVPKDINPIMKGLKPDGTCLYFLNFPGKRCFFLDDNHRCRIHGQMGAHKKPAACRRFPLIAIRTESEIRIGIKPYCYANYRVCDLTPCHSDVLSKYRTEMKETIDDLIENASYRPIIRVPDEEETLQARIQESQILTWLQGNLSYPALLASLAQGSLSQIREFPRPFIQDVQKAFRDLAAPLRQEADKLGSTRHAEYARNLCDLLEKPLTAFDILKPDHHFGKYIRYALYEAVFLRETSRFPAVSLGTFGLALGGLAAAQDPEHASDHLTVWMRLFAQTQAFAMLFPNPQSMAAIMRHLS